MQDGGLENIWLMDFGCSRHKTGNHRWFSSLTPVSSSEHIIFWDKGTGKVRGVGAVPVSESFILRDVALVGNLGYNLLFVSQLLEKGYEIRFKKGCPRVLDARESLVCPVLPFGKVFRVGFSSSSGPSRCLVAGPSSDLWKWHRRLGHLSFDLLAKLSSLDLIRGLPKLKSERDLVCHPYRHGKMVAASHTPVNQVHFMESKDEAFEFVHDLVLRLRNESGHAMRALRSDNGSEFKNDRFKTFCHSQGLEHQFSSPYVPQQNGVVERKNRTLVEMARTMLDEHRTPRKFWAEAINTACYVSNRIFLRAVLNKTSYELRFGWQPKVSHLRVFGCRCFVLKQGNLDKLEPRSDDEIGTTIFEDDDEDVGVSGDTAPAAAPEPAASLSEDDEGAPVPSPSTTWEQPPLDPPIHVAGPAEDVGEGEDGVVVRNKAILVAQASKGFKLFQMDVKSAFLNGFIEKKRALYGLKQAPWAWYERLRKFLVDQGFQMGSVDKTLFLLKHGKDLLIIQIYVDDIIFGGSSHTLCSKLSEQMSREFEMSMMGELQFFLGFQIRQTPQGTFVHQSKYTRDLLWKFEMADASPQMTPMSMSTALDADEDGKEVDQKVYRGMIGSLLYLTATRPDIQFVVVSFHEM
ncbi:hypothetical protein U9M48_042531 [Paspalum notatum var. saurae]|uniref:Integrase catalytic domain-containing protein n=1 Tax=Paspalum notatum var. saurae TaxID=547442 RepID=A0AAQ3XG87_PASNO